MCTTPDASHNTSDHHEPDHHEHQQDNVLLQYELAVDISLGNNGQCNTPQHVNNMKLQTFLLHPRVSSVTLTSYRCSITNDEHQLFTWHNIDNLKPAYMLHSSVFSGSTVPRQVAEEQAVNVMLKRWASANDFEVVATKLGVFDVDLNHICCMDIVVQHIRSREVSLVIVYTGKEYRSTQQYTRDMVTKGTEMHTVAEFAYYNKQLLCKQYNMNVGVYILGAGNACRTAHGFLFQYLL
jgi:hypothetical protein